MYSVLLFEVCSIKDGADILLLCTYTLKDFRQFLKVEFPVPVTIDLLKYFTQLLFI